MSYTIERRGRVIINKRGRRDFERKRVEDVPLMPNSFVLFNTNGFPCGRMKKRKIENEYLQFD